MIVIICTALWLAISFPMCLFAFWVGRCARRLPIIDDHLPWTMSRDQVPRCTERCQARRSEITSSPRWPYGQ